MTEAEWLACEDPAAILRRIQKQGSDRKIRLLSVMPARLRWETLPESPFRHAVETAERYADGLATDAELQAFRDQLYGYIHVGNREWMQSASNRLVLSLAFATTYRTQNRPTVGGGTWQHCVSYVGSSLCPVIRDIFGNPFRHVALEPSWLTPTVVALARGMYESRDFSPMPILADALQDAGCDSDDILNHCRGPGPHVRGCWVVDLVLGKE